MTSQNQNDADRENIARAMWLDHFDPGALPAEAVVALADPKNSPSAFGERMRSFLRYLIDNPLPDTPSYARVYEQLLANVDALSPQEAYVISTAFLGAAASVGYDQIPVRPKFDFPRDHSPKPRAQVGWHFFVGSCWDSRGGEYGVELMFFQSGLFPPNIAAGFELTDEDNQVIELQLAISKRGDRHYQAEPVVLAGSSGLVSSTPDPFSYRLGMNSIECQRAGQFFPLRVRARGVDNGAEQALRLGVDLTFTTGKETLFQGDAGCMPSIDGIGTLYYSIPNMQLDPASSTLELNGETVTLERGTFWFDHQWGFLGGAPRSRVLRAANNTADPAPAGWDWFMAQFDGDRQLTVFAPHTAALSRFYDQTGATLPPTMKVKVAGTYMNPDKSTHIIRGTLEIDDWIKTEHSPNPGRYAVTSTWYPKHWSFAFDEGVPQDISRFSMTPIVDVAQSGFFANGAEYSEGAVVLKAADGTEVGRGFAESVAFANTRRTQHRLAGLPDSQAAIAAMQVTKTPRLLRLANMIYVMRHKNDLERVVKESAGLDFFS
jgi:predicted secreted hydrolase